MKTRIIVLLLCISFSIMASAQASGGQIRRSSSHTLNARKPVRKIKHSVHKDLEGFSMNLLDNKVISVKGITFTMIGVQGGRFNLGESTYHRIAVSSFYIGETEVSQKLWQSIMGYNPSKWVNQDYPVCNVSWDECKEFIQKLNAITNMNFRLPTDAEWEFAARGGNHSRGYKYSGSNNLSDIAWEGYNIEKMKSRRPNELGIYDMCTPIREWCNDIFDYDYFLKLNMIANPQGASSGDLRVLRIADLKERSAEFRNKKTFICGLRLALSE